MHRHVELYLLKQETGQYLANGMAICLAAKNFESLARPFMTL